MSDFFQMRLDGQDILDVGNSKGKAVETIRENTDAHGQLLWLSVISDLETRVTAVGQRENLHEGYTEVSRIHSNIACLKGCNVSLRRRSCRWIKGSVQRDQFAEIREILPPRLEIIRRSRITRRCFSSGLRFDPGRRTPISCWESDGAPQGHRCGGRQSVPQTHTKCM